MRLRDAVTRKFDHYDKHPYESLISVFYCGDTGEYAKVEVPNYGAPEVIERGQVVQRGAYWWFCGTDKQVCDGFNHLGGTLLGDNAAEYACDQFYKTKGGFERSLSRFVEEEQL